MSPFQGFIIQTNAMVIKMPARRACPSNLPLNNYMTKPRRGERIIKEPDQKITPKRRHHDNTLNSQQTEDKTRSKLMQWL